MSLTCWLALAAASPSWGPAPPVAPFGLAPLPKQKSVIPMIYPVLGVKPFTNNYGSNRGKYLHTGIDIVAPKLTPIVAPFSGTLGMKVNSFWIYGDNGYAVLGTHLNNDNPGKGDNQGGRDLMFAPDLEPGQKVIAGQLIGYVGDSGKATGAHFHFELYAPGSGTTMTRLRNPVYSLKMSQKIHRPRAAILEPEKSPKKGEVRYIGYLRRVDGPKFTLILVAKQWPGGRVVALSSPTYRTFKSQDPLDVPYGATQISAYAAELPAAGVFSTRKWSIEEKPRIFADQRSRRITQ